MKILSKEDNKVIFVLDKVTPELANSIRRAAVFKVPTLAIEDVYFTENNSVMYDEQIAIRLGLIPLKATAKEAKFELKVKGPKMVYAKDLKADGAVVLYPEMPIVWLEENHKIELKATAVFGKGEDHAKWNTGWAWYQNYPKISVKQDANAKEGVKHCPRGVFDGTKVKNLERCNLCRACQDYSNGSITVKDVPDKFIFTLESWGQLAPKEILLQAAEIIKSELSELKLK